MVRTALNVRNLVVVFSAVALMTALAMVIMETTGIGFARDQDNGEAPAKRAKKPAKLAPAEPTAPPEPAAADAQPTASAPAAAATPPGPGGAAPAGTAPPAADQQKFDIASQLVKANAGVCAAQVNAMGAGTMAGVTQFNFASHWAVGAPEKRPVSVFIGQRYPAGSAVPFGATGIFAAPNGQGSCDGVAVQVVPSPLPCAKLRDLIAAKGRQIGELAGIPLMEDASGQTMLVPASNNTCVLVGTRSIYAK